jgi:hypothetical protein
VTEASLQAAGKNTETVMNSVMITQFFAQLSMKALMDYLMLMFLMLQYLVYLNFYTIRPPANAEIFNKYMVMFIEFQVLNPEKLIQLLYDKNFTIEGFLSGARKSVNDNSVSTFKHFNLLIIMVSGGSFVVLLMLVVAIIPKFRTKMFSVLRGMKKGFLWNGVIRSIQLSHIKQCIVAGSVV